MSNHDIPCFYCGEDTRGLCGVKGCRSQSEANRCSEYTKTHTPAVPRQARDADDLHVFRIYDKEQQKYWGSYRNGRGVWGGKGPAKNAWNCAQPYGSPKFNEQTRFVVHTFELKRIP